MTPSLRLQVVRVAADQSVSKQGLYFMGQVTLRCAPVEGGFDIGPDLTIQTSSPEAFEAWASQLGRDFVLALEAEQPNVVAPTSTNERLEVEEL